MADNTNHSIVKISELTTAQLASISDHTFLERPESYKKQGVNSSIARKNDFIKFFDEMISMGLMPYSVCVRPEDVSHARSILLKNNRNNIKIASVVGFPDGSWNDTALKVAETKLAIRNGASEIDMVLDVVKFKNGKLKAVERDIKKVLLTAHSKKAVVKLIFETSELSDDEIMSACVMAEKLGVDFVKTSTGFSSNGAMPDQLKIMRKYFSRGVKMSGGVRKERINELLLAASGRDDGMIELDPLKIRIGESKLFIEAGKY
jgi:deoxyribose-phosphate aldolase